MSAKLKIAVIGLGHQALEDHIPAIEASSDVELVAVVDTDKAKLEEFQNTHKNIHVYNDADKLFDAENLDFVVICAPHFAHYEVTKKAIEHKVHVLKEKPFALSLEQARIIQGLADKNKVIVMTTLQRRFNPIYNSFIQLLDKIGKPFFIDIKYTFFTKSPHEGWRGKCCLSGGGCLMDMGYHVIDLLMWYFGLPDSVLAHTSCKAKEGIDYDAEDTAQLVFKYNKSEIFGSMLISRVVPPKQESLNVYGTRGSIHLERGKIECYSPSGEVQEVLTRQNNWPAAAKDQLDYFIKVIQGEKQNITGPDVHANHLAFIEAAYMSRDLSVCVNPKTLL